MVMTPNNNTETKPLDAAPATTNLWTIGRALTWMTERFSESSDSPRLDAQLLLAHVLSCARVTLYTQIDQPLTLEERELLRGVVRRRLSGEPVAYILGVKSWHDMDLLVDSRVLIPRPETETLFDCLAAWSAVSLQRDVAEGRVPLVIDMCTGSGCLALAFARRFPQAKVLALDVSPAALEVARENALRLKVDNVTWLEPTDVQDESAVWRHLGPLLETCNGSLVVVANPPYVTTEEWVHLDLDVRDHEPRVALDGGQDGLDVARAVYGIWNLLSQNFAPVRTKSRPGFLGMELSAGQPNHLAPQACLGNLEVVAEGPFVLKDLAGSPRFLMAHAGAAPDRD